MDTTTYFLASDAALRDVIDGLTPADLERLAPPEWSRRIAQPTLRDILWAHAYDEAWVPDVLAGTAVADGDPWIDRDLLGADPVSSYDALNDAATAAVRAADPTTTVHFQYGDYSVEDGLVHLATYRTFQSWLIAKLVGRDFRLPDAVLDGVEEHVLPHVDEWRGLGIFPPAIDPPADADRETRILCTVGYWHP